MKRLFARQTAVELKTVTDEMQSTVCGGASHRPSHPGGAVSELIPGLWVDPFPYEPRMPSTPAPTYSITDTDYNFSF